MQKGDYVNPAERRERRLNFLITAALLLLLALTQLATQFGSERTRLVFKEPRRPTAEDVPELAVWLLIFVGLTFARFPILKLLGAGPLRRTTEYRHFVTGIPLGMVVKHIEQRLIANRFEPPERMDSGSFRLVTARTNKFGLLSSHLDSIGFKIEIEFQEKREGIEISASLSRVKRMSFWGVDTGESVADRSTLEHIVAGTSKRRVTYASPLAISAMHMTWTLAGALMLNMVGLTDIDPRAIIWLSAITSAYVLFIAGSIEVIRRNMANWSELFFAAALLLPLTAIALRGIS